MPSARRKEATLRRRNTRRPSGGPLAALSLWVLSGGMLGSSIPCALLLCIIAGGFLCHSRRALGPFPSGHLYPAPLSLEIATLLGGPFHSCLPPSSPTRYSCPQDHLEEDLGEHFAAWTPS